ncbi:MAG TPA: PEP/pyruvate-binding domain-containing protein, partial [bacterium]|nr:PEP/pyruvate-binding domain-containing protein [bacterium]
ANQGSREQRLHDFISAVRTIYASTLSEEALNYRARREMLEQDEQMALLVQRVSGVVQGTLFFPHVAGVGFSYNPYVWNREIDPKAGVLRLVYGLGTRAVDRTDDDYTRLVALNAPDRRPVAEIEEVYRYAQKRVDVLDLQANQLVSERFDDVVRQSQDPRVDLVATKDETLAEQSSGKTGTEIFPWILTFDPLLQETDYVATMKRMLEALEQAYGCHVDVEFTTNFFKQNQYRINLVQCRPLQVKGEGVVSRPPDSIPAEDLILEAAGAVIGQSRQTLIERIIQVVPAVYGQLPIGDRYSVARLIGRIMHLRDRVVPRNIMLIGPGRWGTSTPFLGVPVKFGEINNVAVLVEVVEMRDNL